MLAWRRAWLLEKYCSYCCVVVLLLLPLHCLGSDLPVVNEEREVVGDSNQKHLLG